MKSSLLPFLLATIVSSPALAERADRDKPVNLEADKVTVDDKQQLHLYEGNVILTQGTLVIRAERITVKQDAQGYQRGIAFGQTGTPARFRQKREGRDDYVDGEADRIEHDDRSEKTEFFNRARVRSGLDEVSGQYIQFDARTEQYLVTNGPAGTTAAPGSDSRVRAVIQPKNRADTANPAGAAAPASSLPPTQKETRK